MMKIFLNKYTIYKIIFFAMMLLFVLYSHTFPQCTVNHSFKVELWSPNQGKTYTDLPALLYLHSANTSGKEQLLGRGNGDWYIDGKLFQRESSEGCSREFENLRQLSYGNTSGKCVPRKVSNSYEFSEISAYLQKSYRIEQKPFFAPAGWQSQEIIDAITFFYFNKPGSYRIQFVPFFDADYAEIVITIEEPSGIEKKAYEARKECIVSRNKRANPYDERNRCTRLLWDEYPDSLYSAWFKYPIFKSFLSREPEEEAKQIIIGFYDDRQRIPYLTIDPKHDTYVSEIEQQNKTAAWDYDATVQILHDLPNFPLANRLKIIQGLSAIYLGKETEGIDFLNAIHDEHDSKVAQWLAIFLQHWQKIKASRDYLNAWLIFYSIQNPFYEKPRTISSRIFSGRYLESTSYRIIDLTKLGTLPWEPSHKDTPRSTSYYGRTKNESDDIMVLTPPEYLLWVQFNARKILKEYPDFPFADRLKITLAVTDLALGLEDEAWNLMYQVKQHTGTPESDWAKEFGAW